MAERQILEDAIGIRLVHLLGGAKAAAASGAFGLEQMPFARARAHDFSRAGDLEPFGHGLLGFDAFGSSHKLSFQKSAQYRPRPPRLQAVFLPNARFSPIFNDFSGNATVPVASVGVPPTEQCVADKFPVGRQFIRFAHDSSAILDPGQWEYPFTGTAPLPL